MEFSVPRKFLTCSRYRNTRVKANTVYQEYISGCDYIKCLLIQLDRSHIHMNATCWTTLTGFVKALIIEMHKIFIYINSSLEEQED